MISLRGAFLVVVVCTCLQADVNGKPQKQSRTNWDRLVVTFGKFHQLPMTVCEAEQKSWFKDASCGRPPKQRCHRHKPKRLFPGNRYVLGTDNTTRVLYGADDLITGIQATIPVPVGGAPHNVTPPWAVKDNSGNLLFTAYFKNPRKVCKRRHSHYDVIGDRLWILIGDKRQHKKSFLKIPLDRKNLKGTKWVEGLCFRGMGIHYWYDISPNMNCNDFYPVFLLYSKQDGKLKAFGWSFGTYLQGDRWEHPNGNLIRLFFKPATLPKCLLTKKDKDISTQHVYLSDPQKLTC